MNKLKVLELFGGIGACSKALERLGIDYEIADYVEIDKYAVKSFNAIHNTDFEPQDICTWDKDIEVDLIMHGSPCQDFSLAGKQAGGDKDSGTRSSLMYETIRIVEKLKPKYVIWENVKNLLSKKHRHNFDAYLETMEQLGYKNYYQVLNAKDYGIPQNRERVFTVSIKDDSGIRKGAFLGTFYLEDYEANNFEFPPKQELKLKLKDMLEDEVDEKYYLSEKMIKYISADNEKWTGNNDKSVINKRIASAINTSEGSRRCDASNYVCNQVGENYNIKNRAEQVIDMLLETNQIKEFPCCCDSTIKEPKVREISNCITARYDVGIQNQKQVGLCVVEKPRKDIKELDKYCEYCGNKLERKRFNGRLEDFTVFGNRKYCNRECMKRDFLKIGEHDQSYSNAHTTARKINELILHKEVCELCGSDTNLDIHHIDGNWQNNNLDNLMCLCRSCHTKYERNKDKTELRIRKLTPREVWRLMGFDDEDFEKAEKVNSNTQLYKQAGNSIVVNVLEAILKELLLNE